MSNMVKIILTKWSTRALYAIQGGIRTRLFGERPWGAKLKQSTVDRKKKKGSGAPSMALYDTGEFSRKLQATIYTSGSYALVFSTGKTKEQQRGFILGHAKGHPDGGRNPFTDKLPAAKGGNFSDKFSANTIADVGVAIASMEMARFAKNELRKATRGL